jgi:hypothetical protein
MIQPRARIKPGRASLIGGIAVGIASFILWAAVTRELGVATPVILLLGVCVAAGIGAWIRVADL